VIPKSGSVHGHARRVGSGTLAGGPQCLSGEPPTTADGFIAEQSRPPDRHHVRGIPGAARNPALFPFFLCGLAALRESSSFRRGRAGGDSGDRTQRPQDGEIAGLSAPEGREDLAGGVSPRKTPFSVLSAPTGRQKSHIRTPLPPRRGCRAMTGNRLPGAHAPGYSLPPFQGSAAGTVLS